MIPLAELFPAEDYRFHLTLRRGDLRAFFAPMDPTGRLLEARRRWLQADPERYAALEPDAASLLEDWADLVRGWGVAEGSSCVDLGGQLEPDFLLLRTDDLGAFRLAGGALVFPTSWALEEKLGRTMDEIHGVVPGLNPSLGPPIRQFLARLKPEGPAYLRSNWGLAATDAMNLHPTQPRPHLVTPVDPERVWLRVEHQILAALPRSSGVAFGIRVTLHPLTDVWRDGSLRAGFHRALRTMPADLAAYKGLTSVQQELVALSAG